MHRAPPGPATGLHVPWPGCVDGSRLRRAPARSERLSSRYCTCAAGRPLNPLSSPLSSYALTRDGWLFDLGVIGLAVGLVSLVSALVRSGCLATSSPSFAVLSMCCVGLIAVVIFPDRTSDGGLTAIGRTHWVVAMVTFGGLALAPTLLDHGRGPGCSRLPLVARRLSVTAASWFTLLLVGSVLEFVAALPTPLWHIGGLVERALVATEILVAGVLTLWAWSGCPCVSRAMDQADIR